MKTAAIYCRVSTDEQDNTRQQRDLEAFALKAGYHVTADNIFTETGSGLKNDRKERAKIMKLAQARKIDAVIVTELTRWGRSTVDLLTTLSELQSFGVSVVAQTGMQYDLSTAHGKMIAGVFSSLAEFERDLLSERTRSGLKAAVARGKTLGRPKGNKAAAKHRKAVQKFLSEGKTYRWIMHELHIGQGTIDAIAKGE